jgi:MFS family permease
MRSAFVVIAVRPVMVVAFATGLTLVLVVPLALATGIGFALFDVFWNTTMAEQIPPHALSRARAWEWMGSLILLPVAFWPRGRSPTRPAARPSSWEARSSRPRCWRWGSCPRDAHAAPS